MALEDPIKNEQSYVELTCGTENVSPYSTGSGYSDQSTYYHTDYDWHHHQHHQHQQQQIYHQSEQQQQQQQQHQHQQAPVQSLHQLTDIHNSRQYYTPNAYHQDTQELTPVSAYPGLSQHAMHQSDFYNPVLWPSSQADYIPASTLTTQTRLFSGIDVSQHVVSTPLQNGPQGQAVSNAKPKRKRVQSYSQRKAANVRERRRMFHLNEAFDVLRKRLPAFNYEKRLSRIETLRLAMTYISFMKDVSVGEDPKCIKLKPHGLDLDINGQLSSLAHPDGSSLNSSNNSENCDLNAFSNDFSDSSCSNDGLALQGGLH